jgi:hypothetical protein
VDSCASLAGDTLHRSTSLLRFIPAQQSKSCLSEGPRRSHGRGFPGTNKYKIHVSLCRALKLFQGRSHAAGGTFRVWVASVNGDAGVRCCSLIAIRKLITTLPRPSDIPCTGACHTNKHFPATSSCDMFPKNTSHPPAHGGATGQAVRKVKSLLSLHVF